MEGINRRTKNVLKKNVPTFAKDRNVKSAYLGVTSAILSAMRLSKMGATHTASKTTSGFSYMCNLVVNIVKAHIQRIKAGPIETRNTPEVIETQRLAQSLPGVRLAPESLVDMLLSCK